MKDAIERPSVDYVILADSAEAINNKLYLLGGGWDRLTVLDFAQPIMLTIAFGLRVPWHEANTRIALNVLLEHEDGSRIEPEFSAETSVGRPADAIRGQDLVTPFALRAVYTLPREGTYVVGVRFGEAPPKTFAFHAVQGIQPQAGTTQ